MTGEAKVTCVYCGQAYPAGTPTHGAKILTEHIKVCAKHPMRAAEDRLAALRALAERLIANNAPGSFGQGIAAQMIAVLDGTSVHLDGGGTS